LETIKKQLKASYPIPMLQWRCEGCDSQAHQSPSQWRDIF
jgi:hypothetical protein